MKIPVLKMAIEYTAKRLETAKKDIVPISVLNSLKDRLNTLNTAYEKAVKEDLTEINFIYPDTLIGDERFYTFMDNGDLMIKTFRINLKGTLEKNMTIIYQWENLKNKIASLLYNPDSTNKEKKLIREVLFNNSRLGIQLLTGVTLNRVAIYADPYGRSEEIVNIEDYVEAFDVKTNEFIIAGSLNAVINNLNI